MRNLLRVIDEVFTYYLESDLEDDKRKEVEGSKEEIKKVIQEDFERWKKETFKNPVPINRSAVYYTKKR